MTYKIKVIGLEMEESIILNIDAETPLQAMSKAEKEAENRQLEWDTLEMV